MLQSLLEKVERENGPGRQWLKWIKKIELDWVTFPNLTFYPPDRDAGGDLWYWEHDQDDIDVDVDYVLGAQYNGRYDEHDHEGGHYDDNFYHPSDASLYPSFRLQSTTAAPDVNDPFGFANHNPFTIPSQDAVPEASADEIATKLDLLVSMEVTPLFEYLTSSTFDLASITIPLYFISKQSHYDRSVTRPGFALPLKIRYWVHVCVHALLMLRVSSSSLRQVCVKYLPWDVWASMDPADDLARVVDKGVWFDGPDDGEGSEREGEGAAFRAVWAGLRGKFANNDDTVESRTSFNASIKLVPWDGNVDSWRVGDELEVVFTRREEQLGVSK